MEIYPAIDLQGGRVVRLTQGDFAQMEVYSSNPADVASGFRAKGALNLHVVDLDGAKDGAMVNFDVIRDIVRSCGLHVQVGGGIRDEERVKRYLELGVSKVILGTAAIKNFTFMEDMLAKYGKQIAVGVDARDGKVAVSGWMETTGTDSVEFCERLAQAGVQTIIYTDISHDGAMKGTNLDIYRILAKRVSCDIIASGGISFVWELEALKNIGIYGAILGKALYTNTLDVGEVLRKC